MNEKFTLASTASLIADPARAAMLTVLLDARPRSAGELALTANVSAQSASMHLSQLLTGGFLRVTREGRYRYYRIASRHVAHAIEALGTISTRQASNWLQMIATCLSHGRVTTTSQES
jgi:DNA-binding transcriptional ArsR family regulator